MRSRCNQWIVEPDFDQEGDIQEAERHLANAAGLVGVGEALWSWLDSGRTRPPVPRRPGAVLDQKPASSGCPSRSPVPRAPERRGRRSGARTGLWRFWRPSRARRQTIWRCCAASSAVGAPLAPRVPAQRSTSRAALAVDVMAATPLISATTLAKAIGMSIKCANRVAGSVS